MLYRAGLFCWSFSIEGKPAGKSYLTKELARRAAVQKPQAKRLNADGRAYYAERREKICAKRREKRRLDCLGRKKIGLADRFWSEG